MASILYNSSNSALSNIMTFTDIPNILKVSAGNGGYQAYIRLTFVGNLYGQTTNDGQFTITLWGDTISNVLDWKNAVNKNFRVGESNNDTAASVTRALRNCPNLAANFTVIQDENTVTIRCREIGSMFYQNFSGTTIPSGYIDVYGSDGSFYTDSLNGALIDVDVISNGKYITTLEKNMYNGEAAFDVSPVLTTMAEHGKTVPYDFHVSYLKDGQYGLIGTLENNYISVGYMVNQGYKYIPMVTDHVELAQNVSRGSSNTYTNKTLLYVYQPNITLSMYHYSNVNPYVTVKYYDSAMNFIANTTSTSWPRLNNDVRLYDITMDLNTEYFNKAFYIEVEIGEEIELLYQVIKPLKATEYSQRIYWRNSYGGISFFDFTGPRSETRDVDISTYQKSIFNYYSDSMNELDKVYDNDVKYVVTLKSHLFEHDGKYVFNDLIQSSKVWTRINGQDYAIIIDSVSVEEQNQNNIYQATLKYHYSMTPSLI